MKHVKPSILVLFFLLFVLLIPAQAAAAKNNVSFVLTHRGDPTWVKLYINGRYRGRIYHSKQKKFALARGKRYSIRVYRRMSNAYYYKNMSFYLKPSAFTKTVTISLRKRVRKISRYRRLRIRLSRRSKVYTASLYINGRYKGKISRRRYRSFRARTGRYYTIVAKHNYRGARYYVKRRVFVSSSRRTRYIFLKPKAQDQDDDGE